VVTADGGMLDLETDYRRHAIVEQSIAEFESAGLATRPRRRRHAIFAVPGENRSSRATRVGS